MALILLVATTLVFHSQEDTELHSIDFRMPEVRAIECFESSEKTLTLETFKLDSVILTSQPSQNEIDSVAKKVSTLIRQRKLRTGIIIDISRTSYKAFIGVLDIFIQNEIKQVCFDGDRIYFFPVKPPGEYMKNRLYINDEIDIKPIDDLLIGED